MRVKLIFISIVLFQSGCSDPKVDIPEYAKHDWYAHYIVDENTQSIFKDGDDPNIEPWLNSTESYGFKLLPDSTEEILYISMQSSIILTLAESNTQIWFSYKIVTQDQELIEMKGQSKEVRLNKLLTYFKGRQYLNITGNRITSDYVTIRLQDKKENFYLNDLSSGVGTIGVILDYEISVVDVSIMTHQEHGDVIQLTMNFMADVQDINRMIDYTIESKTKTYLIVPFE